MSIKLIRRNWSSLAAHPVAKNAASLYALQFANIVFPLVLTAYLARVLMPTGFGIYLFFYSLSLWVYTAIEYGFSLFATREISAERDNCARTAEIVQGVLGGQGFLAVGIFVVGAIASVFFPILHDHPEFSLLCLLFGIFRGLGPMWYFQGTERMQVAAALEVAGRTGSTLLTLLLVRSPSSAWIALALPCFASVMVTAAQMWLIYRQVRFRFPKRSEALTTLRKGWGVFVYRFSANFYTSANVVILGMIASPATVSFFGGAEKIVRGLLTLISPIVYALYPRINNLLSRHPAKAWYAIRFTLFAFIAGGGLAAVILFAFARLWTDLLLGPGYEDAVPILRVLALVAVFLPVSTVVSVLVMLPLKMERTLNVIVLSASCLNLFFALFFYTLWGGLGMGVASVSTEIFVTSSTCIVLARIFFSLRGLGKGM